MIKLSTSTLGCLHWDLPTTINRLKQFGFVGIDFRGLKGELNIWKLPEFSTQLTETAQRLRDEGLAVSCISSSITLTPTNAKTVAQFDDELERSIEICAALPCRQIRIFGGALHFANKATEADRPRVIALAAERAQQLADRARKTGSIDLLIETHDDWTRSDHMAELLHCVNRDNVACVWDVKHTYWAGREVPETSWERLKPWVRNTHWKDARRYRGPKDRYKIVAAYHGLLCLLGEGIVPAADFHDLLAASGYDGWYTLEWEKQWHPHIEEADVAFPQFVRYMRDLEARWHHER